MKNKLIVIAMIICVLLISLTGCNNQPSVSSTNTPTDKADSASAVDEESYPTKAIELYCPSGAGGGSDVFARTIAQVIEKNKLCTQPIVVINKAGGSGAIGYSYVAEKKGDPYVLSIMNSSYYAVPLAGQSPVSYKDFQHISLMCQDPLLVLAKAGSGLETIQDLFDNAKVNPGKLTAGGTSTQGEDALSYYAIKNSTGLNINYVPFAGSGEVLAALLGGHVNFAFLGPSEALAQIEAGDFVVLATTTGTRIKEFPDCPTLIESGVNVELCQNRGIVAPLGIGEGEIAYLEDLFKRATQTPEWQEYLKSNSMIDKYLNAEQFTEVTGDISNIYEEYMKFVK